uniref:Uncharacterized protein n=1 Tax=Rhizophora mucronata TaxID=61149 RepID=A0A2P2QZ63_RHIMU
MSDLFESFGP